ncbi:MAG: ABC transporter permease [candidate division Zixibacteria bacterium]|nr:ABC transporter permease [candidate division Zixibacteria bacterium]
MRSKIPFGLIALIIIWGVIASIKIINPIFLPSPLDVLVQFWSLSISGEIAQDVYSTIYRLVIGFSLGISVGVPVGLLMGYSNRIYNALEIVIEMFRSIPVVALFPLFLIFFGLGDASKFTIAAWSSSLIILINTMYGVKNSKKTRIMVAQTMKATPGQIFVKIVFPEALPDMFVGFRTGLSIALIVVIMSEMFMGTQTGLGQKIFNAHLLYEIPEMYALIIITGLIGFILNKLFLMAEKHFLHWAGK